MANCRAETSARCCLARKSAVKSNRRCNLGASSNSNEDESDARRQEGETWIISEVTFRGEKSHIQATTTNTTRDAILARLKARVLAKASSLAQ